MHSRPGSPSRLVTRPKRNSPAVGIAPRAGELRITDGTRDATPQKNITLGSVEGTVTDSRTVPHSLDAEQAVIGALIVDDAGFSAVAADICAGDFFRASHAEIWRAMAALHGRGRPIDLPLLVEELRARGTLETVANGPAAVAALVDGVPRSVNVEHYAHVIRDKSIRRSLLELSRTLDEGARSDEDLAALVERIGEAGARAVGGAAGRIALPPFQSLRTQLSMPLERLSHRIQGFQILDTRVGLSAQYKAGKTTLRNSMIKSLVDGEPFLGTYDVRRLDGVIAVLDFELSDRMGLDWHRAAGIDHDDQVWPLFLRGRASTFNILDRGVRRAWAQHFRAAGVTYVILDCVRPLMDALGLDEHRDGGRILAAIDELLEAAYITEACVVAHMGHNGERARGDSRFRDWPDAEWRLVRQTDDPASPRYLSAFGRDIDVPESQLDYDSSTRRLTVVGGSRQDLKAQSALDTVIEVISPEGSSGRAVKAALRDSELPRQAIEDALKYGVRCGRLTVTAGARNARKYHVSGSVPDVSRNTVPVCPAAFIRRDTGTHTSDQPVSRTGGLHV